jgi:predicted MPP superfamily phosphohydrolase
MSFKFFFLILTMLGLAGSFLAWFMYRTGFSVLKPWWTLVPFLIMPLLFGAANVGLNVLPRGIVRNLAWAGGIWIGFVYYSFLLLAIYGVLWVLGRICHWPNLAPNAAISLFFVAVLSTGLGVYQCVHPNIRRYTLRTYKPIPQSYRIVFASDLHFGALFGKGYGRRFVERINQERPDMVILGGDLVDRSLDFAVREGSLETLRKIKAPVGVFAVMGNHDLANGTGEQEREYLEKMGIRFVVNETIPINSIMWLTGLDDYRFGKRDYAIPHMETAKLNLFVEHEPRHVLEAGQKGYDLYFAGHTHGGQMVPLNLITQQMYVQDHGTDPRGNMLSTVSTGYGLSFLPIRLGVPPEIVVVTVEPIKNKRGV